MKAESRTFCTLFDVNYAVRALALYRSLEATHRSFTLRMFCMDDEAKRAIDGLALPFAETVSIGALEAHDPELAAVRPGRKAVEYCWTATPAVCLYCLERDPSLTEITYLDADLMFFSDSEPLFAELGDDSILITPHRFAPEWAYWEAGGGSYNVQFMTFRATPVGIEALRWWRARCLEWCFDRHEPGRFGDQKYLDDWPIRFPGVHVLEHAGGGLAPWNSSGQNITRWPAGPMVNGVPLIFYHCHGVDIYLDRFSRFWCGLATLLARLGLSTSSYRLIRRPLPLGWRTYPPFRVSGSGASAEEHGLIWTPYCRLIGRSYEDLRRLQPGFASGSTRLRLGEFAFWIARDLVPSRWRRLLGKVRRGLEKLLEPRPRFRRRA